MLVHAYRIHAAGTRTGTIHLEYRAVGAHILASAALDAFILIYYGSAVADTYGALGADLLAGVLKAALTHLRHMIVHGGAGIACEFYYIDERRIVVLLGYGALVHSS